jgi:hypothetical protein
MTNETLNLILAIASYVLTSVGIFLAIKGQLRKNSNDMLHAKLIEEKRHAAHEKSLSLFDQKISQLEKQIDQGIANINDKLNVLSGQLINNQGEAQQ